MNFKRIVQKAQQSSFYLKILNIGLSRSVPFNKPHGFRILEIGGDYVKTSLPYRRANFNHIKGIHACALATLAEFTSGLLLLTKLDPDNYRIILQNLSMEYHYQAKMKVYAEFRISDAWMEENVYNPLEFSESAAVSCKVRIHDEAKNHISTGRVIWQIKSWKKVKTKV